MNFINRFHAAIRRNLFGIERLLVAAILTALLWQLFLAQPVYPMYWDTVILAGSFLALLFWPVLGYFACLLAALYPLVSISIYIAVLFLAIALIGQRWFIPNLGLVAFTLSAPFLNGAYLAWLVPLLGGLWWGPRAGLLAGLVAAAWGKIVFGLIGFPPDWLKLGGLYPDLALVLLRFRGLDSLQVLGAFIRPLTPDSTTALYHTLQISIWGLTGWGMGYLILKDRVQYYRPRTTVGLVAAGALTLALLQGFLFVWLGFAEIYPILLNNLLPNLLLCSLVGMSAESLFYFFEHPWNIPSRAGSASSYNLPPQEDSAPPNPIYTPPGAHPSSGTSRPPAKEHEDDSFIMIELD